MSVRKPIYLDSAATAMPDPECLLRYVKYVRDFPFNPSSVYDGGRMARQALEDARRKIAKCIHCGSEDIYFTSGGTEGNNMILRGFFKDRNDGLLITTQIEHPSILRVAEDLGVKAYYLPVDEDGRVSADDLNNTLEMEIRDGMNKDNILVSIQYANNEIGTVQDISLLSEISHKHGAHFHTDAVQYFPHRMMDLDNQNCIDAITVSGHKFGAPRGTGFIVAKKTMGISPIILGGGQENGMRSGTENVGGWLAMTDKLCEMYCEDEIDRVNDEHCFFGYLSYYLHSNGIEWKPNGMSEVPIYSMTFHGVNASALISLLSERDIYLSAGSACHSYEPEPSHVLKAIGLSDEDAKSTVRICYYEDWRSDDLDYAIKQLVFCIKLLRGE